MEFVITNEQGFYLESKDKTSISWTCFKDCAKVYTMKAAATIAAKNITKRTRHNAYVEQF